MQELDGERGIAIEAERPTSTIVNGAPEEPKAVERQRAGGGGYVRNVPAEIPAVQRAIFGRRAEGILEAGGRTPRVSDTC